MKYTAKKDGIYNFTLKDTNDQQVQLDAYKNIATKYPSDLDIGCKATRTRWFGLPSGNAMFFQLKNTTEETQYYLFTVTMQEETNTYTFEFNIYGETQDMTFIAPEAGTYRIIGFVPDNGVNNDFKIWINKSHEDEGLYNYDENVYESNNNIVLFEQQIEQGETVYLDMVPWNYSEGNNSLYGGSISLQIEKLY